MSLRLLIVAGEASGDMHAAGLLKALRTQAGDIECYGIGGDALQAQGMTIVRHIREMAVMGLAELLPKLFFFRRVFNETIALAKERRPDAVILVDYPDFNLRLAARLHAAGIKVIYYISPQVWAWRRSRIPAMARTIDRLLVIFPFEPDTFKDTNLKVDYVGHPLLDETLLELARPVPELPWQGEPRIALLPGSRRQEVLSMLPVYLDAAEIIAKLRPGAGFIIASPSDEIADLARECLKRRRGALARCEVVGGHTRQVVRTARAAMVASGTATLETALMRCPMAIAYKVAPLTFLLLRQLVSVQHIGMVNILAGRTLCHEFIQSACRPSALADAVCRLLDDTPERTAMLDGFAEVASKLGDGGAHDRAAAKVLEELHR